MINIYIYTNIYIYIYIYIYIQIYIHTYIYRQANSALPHKNKVHFKIYSDIKQLLWIVIIFQNNLMCNNKYCTTGPYIYIYIYIYIQLQICTNKKYVKITKITISVFNKCLLDHFVLSTLASSVWQIH